MWNLVNFAILISEVFILVKYIRGMIKNKTVNHAMMLLGVFVINFALHFVPYMYYRLEMNMTENSIYNIFECLSGAVRNFVGEVTTSLVVDYGKIYSEFSVIYSVGTLLAMGMAVSTIISLFSHKVANSLKLFRMGRLQTCNIVTGNSNFTEAFAQQNLNTVVLMPYNTDKGIVDDMIDNKRTVICENFSSDFLKSRFFRKKCRYNIICSCDYELTLEYICEFLNFRKQNPDTTNIYIYFEIDEEKMEITSEEIIENSGSAEYVNLFNSNELYARTLVDENSMAKALPGHFLQDDTSLKNDVNIEVFMFGYSGLNKEIYKHLLLSNQFVKYDRGYHPCCVKYHIYDKNANNSDWNIGGIKATLDNMDKDSFFPLPEMPFETRCYDQIPQTETELAIFANKLKSEAHNTFSYIFIDLDDEYKNIELAVKIRKLISGTPNGTIFVKTKVQLFRSYSDLLCYGDMNAVLTEDIVVNESMHVVAKAINENYMRMKCGKNISNEEAAAISEASWNKMNYSGIKSNVDAAMAMRTKLNLLGLDFVNDGNKKI